MKRFLFVILAIALVVSALGTITMNAQEPEYNFLPGMVLAGLAVGVSLDDFYSIEGLNVTGVRVLMVTNRYIEDHPIMIFRVERGIAIYFESQDPQDVYEAIEIIKSMPGVLFAEPNYYVNAIASPPGIATTSLPNGRVGTLYSQTLTATGDGPIFWSVESGNLPDGLALAVNGEITGTPTASGTFDFTVKATNLTGSDTRALSIVMSNLIDEPGPVVYGDVTGSGMACDLGALRLTQYLNG